MQVFRFCFNVVIVIVFVVALTICFVFLCLIYGLEFTSPTDRLATCK